MVEPTRSDATDKRIHYSHSAQEACNRHTGRSVQSVASMGFG